MSDREVLLAVYNLIHPDTTPDGNEVSDGEILDMIYELVERQLKKGI
jgi:hypothetical protein